MKYKTKLTLKIFLQHAFKYKLVFLLLTVGIFIGTLVGLIIPFYFKRFFDILSYGITATSQKELITVLFSILSLYGVQWGLHRFNFFLNNYFQPHVMVNLSHTCFAYLQKHSFSFFNNNFGGSLVKRVTRFYRAFEGIADRMLWQFFPLIINVLFILGVLFQKNITLGLMMLVWLIVFIIANWFLTNFKMKYDIQKSEADTKATGILADTITNQANVKLFGGYEREQKLFGSAMEKVRRLRKFTWDLDGLVDGVQGLLTIGLEAALFYFAIELWRQGKLSLGDFVLIQTFLIQIVNHIWDFGRMIRNIYENLAEAEEMTEILSTPHEIQDRKNAKSLQVKKGIIEFQNVDFHYHQTRPVLKKFNLKIFPHERVGLVGHSGAGKSTIVRILLRMHDVSNGKILIDDQKISDVTQESLWKNVSLVPQEPILFHRTLLENIRYGKPDATQEEVIEASKLAHCHEFIDELPEKYETFVGERGVKLSGGERQRVAIARAILCNSPILVLDEATSSLDSESEMLIQQALENLMKNKTVIVIAHRLSTIMKMDRIIVMDKGTVVEEGTHKELLKQKNGMYKQLWDLQVGGFITE
jgi:ATP-binding cassette subfamily B protein